MTHDDGDILDWLRHHAELKRYSDTGEMYHSGLMLLRAVAEIERLRGVAQAVPAPVAWRVTDGEGDYEYLTEEPSDQSRAWSRRYDREWEPLYASPVPSTLSSPAASKPVSFLEAMNIVERGFDTWKDKPHNAKWYSRIDGTPIPNDLKVNIAEAICHSTEHS